MASYTESSKDYFLSHSLSLSVLLPLPLLLLLLLEPINELREVAGYKVNKHKLIIFLYTNNGYSENNILKLSFTKISKILKN